MKKPLIGTCLYQGLLRSYVLIIVYYKEKSTPLALYFYKYYTAKF